MHASVPMPFFPCACACVRVCACACVCICVRQPYQRSNGGEGSVGEEPVHAHAPDARQLEVLQVQVVARKHLARARGRQEGMRMHGQFRKSDPFCFVFVF